MSKTITSALVTLGTAAIGFYLGTTIHGASWLTFVSTAAGAAGGCLASVVAIDMWRGRRHLSAKH